MSIFERIFGSYDSGARQMPRRMPSVPEIEHDDGSFNTTIKLGSCQMPQIKPSLPDPEQD
jgi:hypothetical protein